MKPNTFKEKRKFKRIDLSLPMRLKRILSNGKEEIISAFTSNVSYNGVYIPEPDLKDINPEDSLHISLSVPRDNTRDFPFSRLTGMARVARIEREGIGLEFIGEIHRLFVASL